jgi:hypothetical protein
MLLGFDHYLAMWLFTFSVAISNSKALSSGICSCAVRISVCLRSLIPCTLISWEQWFRYITQIHTSICRFQWPCFLRCSSTAACLPWSWVRIVQGAWRFACCVLSGRGLCDELITRPEESYWLARCCVWSRWRLMEKPSVKPLRFYWITNG